MAEYCATDPTRMTGVALVPTADITLAAREAEHAAALGLPAVMVRPNRLYGRDLGDREYDPLYDVLEAHDLTLSVHEGLGVMGPTIGRDRMRDVRVAPCAQPSDGADGRDGQPHAARRARAASRRCESRSSSRAPAGCRTGWPASTRTPSGWPTRETGDLTLLPSEYFARQCAICTDPDDPLAAWVVHEIGAERVMWASDFPHPDALYPNAVVSFLHEAEEHGLSGADAATVLWETPVGWYGWPDARPQAQGSSRRR